MTSPDFGLHSSQPVVLLVQHNRFLSEMMCEWMRSSGYQVHCAGNERETLLALGARRFDLVLLDLDLHRGEGLSLLASVESKLCGASVVLLTGAVNYDDVLARIPLEAPCVKVEKPYSFFALGLVMKSVLARARPGNDKSGPWQAARW
jgi:DNA-binding response OmpR family regulator